MKSNGMYTNNFDAFQMINYDQINSDFQIPTKYSC
jgi:hypothetical protein